MKEQTRHASHCYFVIVLKATKSAMTFTRLGVTSKPLEAGRHNQKIHKVSDQYLEKSEAKKATRRPR